MNATEVIQRLCALQTEVQQLLGYTHAADCFCGDNPIASQDYRNDGACLEFIERAVREKIEQSKRDLCKIHGHDTEEIRKDFPEHYHYEYVCKRCGAVPLIGPIHLKNEL